MVVVYRDEQRGNSVTMSYANKLNERQWNWTKRVQTANKPPKLLCSVNVLINPCTSVCVCVCLCVLAVRWPFRSQIWFYKRAHWVTLILTYRHRPPKNNRGRTQSPLMGVYDGMHNGFVLEYMTWWVSVWASKQTYTTSVLNSSLRLTNPYRLHASIVYDRT